MDATLHGIEQAAQAIRWRLSHLPNDLPNVGREVAALCGESHNTSMLFGRLSAVTGQDQDLCDPYGMGENGDIEAGSPDGTDLIGVAAPCPAVTGRRTTPCFDRERPQQSSHEPENRIIPNSRSDVASKAAETRRRQKVEEKALYKKENYLVHGPDKFLSSYPAGENSLDDVLDACVEMVSDDEYPLSGVVVWLDGELVGAAKRGEDGEAIVTALKGPLAGCRRALAQS